MRPVNVLKFTIGANQSYRLPAQGSSFKILGATGLVLVKGDWGSIDQCAIGQGITGTDFSYLVFTDLSGASNTLRVIVGDAGFIDNVTGTVGVTGTVTTAGTAAVTSNVMPTHAAVYTNGMTIGTGSTLVLAASATRQAFAIQNRSASSNIYVGFGGAPTASSGWMVGPGVSWEPPVISTQAIYAIADVAATPASVLWAG